MILEPWVEVPLNIVNLTEFTRIQNALITAQADLRKAHIKRGRLSGRQAFASQLTDAREFDRLRKIRDEADALRFRTVLDTEEGLTWGRPAPKEGV